MGDSTGRLEVICGPMFAGKTTELLRRLREAHIAGLRVLAVKPRGDTRSGDALRTHTGDALPALTVDGGAEIGFVDAEVVGIDEAHFFGSQLVEPVSKLIGRGTRIIIAGVERDHRGLPFEPFPRLLCEADEVTKLAARCAACGGSAIHSQRLLESDAPIVVGGAEAYEARCRRCFTPGK